MSELRWNPLMGEWVATATHRQERTFLPPADFCPLCSTKPGGCDWHPPETKHFEKHGGTWPVHCVQKTHGAEFHPELLDDPRIAIISKGCGDKDNYSAFDGTDLAARLAEQEIGEVWVGGLATDYCVKNTVLDALRKGFKVKAIANAMRPVELKSGDGERAIAEMQQQGAEII